MIKTFRHAGIESFFLTESKAGIRPEHAPKLKRQLERLDSATSPADMHLPGWRFHSLSGDLEGHWSVTVNKNWRLTFSFDGDDAILVDYQDYH